MSKEDGGPAFPGFTYDGLMEINSAGEGKLIPSGATAGMSLRDWFAGHALQGILASNGNLRTDTGVPYARSSDAPQNAALHAYRFADAMLGERSK